MPRLAPRIRGLYRVGKAAVLVNHAHMREGSWERDLGRTIRRRRMARKLTLQQAADGLGVSLRWWQDLEKGSAISVRTLVRVAASLKVPAWRLLKG